MLVASRPAPGGTIACRLTTARTRPGRLDGSVASGLAAASQAGLVAAQPAKELPKAATMATEYLRVLVNTVAIRDEPGSTDRLGDFTKNDAVKLVQPCPSDGVPEWVEVDMVGAIREPPRRAARDHRKALWTRNRVATLLEPWTVPMKRRRRGTTRRSATTARRGSSPRRGRPPRRGLC